ncbi:ABC transporter substrate-binding protein [Paenibacillus sp. BSR1-1]|uniref:ABC transporter substrate-binding protein n=1 Tax=Paenibacillus sp. BSR1-1 TaxID=3020845 RepID=UPI0025B23469|nr:ABC transporter substrate-binding protein [Paenibacillus sp. BSR1-1]MDN3019575.1 ABC transporter substrate-binding protein [Paenibacillus sp. BSR1-1]
MSNKAKVISALFLSLMLLLAGCGSNSKSSSSAAKETTKESTTAALKHDKSELVVGLDDDPPQLDPHFSTAAVDRQVFHSIYDTLVDVDEKLNFVPALAEKWEISQDAKTYTFFLRKNVKFHDGTPFNAEAVKFNFERMMDPKAGSPRASELSSVQSIEVIDENTLKVQLSKPYSPFLAALSDRAGMMVSPTAVKEKGADFANSPVGTGPFKFVSRVKQDKIEVAKNPDYWGGAPKFEKITYRPYADENVRLTNLTSGDVDIISKVPPKDVEKLKTDSNLKLSEVGALGFQGLYLNNKNAPFNNKALRQALNLVIDRDAIIKVALRNTAVPSAGAIPPSSWAFDKTLKPTKQNIEKAKKIMADAGFPSGFSFTLQLPAKPVEQQMGQMIQSMAAEAGIKVKLELVEFGTMLDNMDNYKFDAVRLGWSGRTDPDGNIFALYHTTGSINYGYSNPKMDQLLEAARVETDQAKRKEIYSQAAKLGQEEVPYIFLYHELDYKAYKNNLQGYKHIPDTMMRFQDVSFK